MNKMKNVVISDIRLYKYKYDSNKNDLTKVIYNNKDLNIIIHRIVMKLRENNFSIGCSDHLYICLCDGPKEFIENYNIDNSYFTWIKYCPIKINDELYNNLDNEKYYMKILDEIKNVLLNKFSNNEVQKNIINNSFEDAITNKENMLMKYKEKISKTRKAVIYLRLLDSGMYYPLLKVYDMNNNTLFIKDLPQSSIDLNQYGQIQLSSTRVTIVPRNNAFSTSLTKLIFNYG